MLVTPTLAWVAVAQDRGGVGFGVAIFITVACALGLSALAILPGLMRGDRP